MLILKKGEKLAGGTLVEVVAQYCRGEPTVSLEEVFIRATGETEG